MFDALFDGIFVIIVPGETASLLPKTDETPSRGPPTPLYGGKGSVLRGNWTVTKDPLASLPVSRQNVRFPLDKRHGVWYNCCGLADADRNEKERIFPERGSAYTT